MYEPKPSLHTHPTYMSNAIPMGFWIKGCHPDYPYYYCYYCYSFLLTYISSRANSKQTTLDFARSNLQGRQEERKTTKTITRKLADTTSIGGCRVESMKILVDIVLLWISSSLIFHSAITYFHIHVRYYNMKTYTYMYLIIVSIITRKFILFIISAST